jgi:fucose 4-O-acetylase-like acetyltransferase
MKRDLYIDFAKGLATLSVVFIHTVFWSGQLYVPREVRLLSLLADVPIFFVLSGLTSSGNIEKTIERLLRLQITYSLFVGLLFVLSSCLDFSQFSWETLGNWLLHNYSPCPSFKVVMGSFWYLKVYFVVMFLGAVVLRYFPKLVKHVLAFCILLYFVFNLYVYPSGQVGYVCFYLAIYLAAGLLKGRRIPSKSIPYIYAGCLLFGTAVMAYHGTWEIIYKLNKQKFPPQLVYMFWASFAMVTTAVGYQRFRINRPSFITYVGQNAIFFYFGQGISSSLIYPLVEALKADWAWYLLLPLAFVLNVILATLIAKILQIYDAWAWRKLYQIKAYLGR